MKAVILNSGIGSRMGGLTENQPKCMVSLNNGESILSRQLKLLIKAGITDILITIGPYENMIPDYVASLYPDLTVEYVRNNNYDSTNYIYSMYLADTFLRNDILLLHGDIVMEEQVLLSLLKNKKSNIVIIDSTIELPEKDFKCVIVENKVREVGVDITESENTFFLLPVYKLSALFMEAWMNEIGEFISNDKKTVYAENAFNLISSNLDLEGFDIKGKFCMEVDTIEDLNVARNNVK